MDLFLIIGVYVVYTSINSFKRAFNPIIIVMINLMGTYVILHKFIMPELHKRIDTSLVCGTSSFYNLFSAVVA